MARVSLRRLGERADLSVPRGSPQMGARYDADAFGRFAEGMARFLGTGRFIVGQTVLVIGWIILNTVGAIKHWDPYPFILLNLAFSTQAAYAAPLILLAQNRQDDRDRANIERDREVAARTQADTEFLARELAAVRLALADMVTTQDLEDSLSRLAMLIADQPLPDGHGPLTPSDRELPHPGDQVIRRAATVVVARAGCTLTWAVRSPGRQRFMRTHPTSSAGHSACPLRGAQCPDLDREGSGRAPVSIRAEAARRVATRGSAMGDRLPTAPPCR